MDLRDIFASNLRRLRHEKGISQEELAHMAKVNRTYVSKLETGVAYAGLEIIGRLADALEVDAIEFLKGASRQLSLAPSEAKADGCDPDRQI
jgi:transcriptional regulator with XRE-family HTH domain